MNDSSYIAWPGTAEISARAGRDQLGGKAAALDALADGDFPVPAWFALTPRAFADSRSGGDVRAEIAPSFTVQRVLERALDRLRRQTPEENLRLAVRSSAPEEDVTAHSFAGQLESFLGVDPADVPARVAGVWRSAFSKQTRAYRCAQGLSEDCLKAPAVLVQRMVRARCAGVAFSADPADGERGIAVVSAVRGLGTLLVGGAETGDTYRVDRAGTVTDREITSQHEARRFADGDVRTAPLPDEEGRAPTLTDDEAWRIAALARRAERHFETPQDIEWAFDEKGGLHLLQSRPITTLGNNGKPFSASGDEQECQQQEQPLPTLCRSLSAQAEGARILWDNSNIAESYGGVTTPLTFSFARRSYRAVYRAFCRALGVPRSKVEARAGAFRSMIGLVRGRLYYNLQSWYEVLRLLPGFRFNRAFMEDMMGVSERLPNEFLPEREAASLGEKARDAGHLLRSAFKLVRQHRRIDERARVFRQHVDRTLAASPAQELEGLRLDALAARYGHLEDELFGQWEVPIINDFLTMIFFGLSRRLLAAWGPADGEALHGALLSDPQNVVSAEPARRIGEMAEWAAGDAALVEVLLGGTRADFEAAMRKRPEFAESYEVYLERFSDRCLGELKLESRTLREDPLPLLRAVGAQAQKRQRGEDIAPENAHPARREQAETRLAEALKGHPVRRRLVRWCLRHTRARIATRENLRFERTRVFGTARRLFTEMGRRLADEGCLDDARDVFYLEVEELLGFARGTSTTTALSGIAAVRREEFARYRNAPAPPDRFVTCGAVHLAETLEAAAPAAGRAADPPGENVRTGQGCGGGMAGKTRGPACVVEDPREATLTGDEILVARQTDPGWTPLFASCRGVVVERGNLLSHAAVVAREMGLPAVVGVKDATQWLRDAERVEVDGNAGTVRVLDGNASGDGTSSNAADERRMAEVAG